MPKFETQINQIYLVHPESKKNSLVLYEEKLRDNLQLFFVLELVDIKKRTEANELKKISEAILTSFRKAKKMPAGGMFETTLAEINGSLAELAHKGSKSWIGKFSALIAIKSDSEVFLANSGQCSAWIKRKREFSEILGAEKRGEHPLKTFVNFSSGKISDNDCVVITTNNLFNFVSLELLTKLLGEHEVPEASDQVCKILKDSAGFDDSFAAFFLTFLKQTAESVAANPVPEIVPASEVTEVELEPQLTPEPEEPVYAPLPGQDRVPFKLKLPSLSFGNPLNSIKKVFSKTQEAVAERKITNFEYFRSMSGSAKFFLATFLIFLAVLVANLTLFGTNSASKKHQQQASDQTEIVLKAMASAESALIYNNESQGMRLLGEAKTELEKLKDLDSAKYTELSERYQQLSDRINRVTTVANPKIVAELKLNPSYIAKAGSDFIFSGTNSNTVAVLSGSYKPLFLLNSTDTDITGINHVPGSGNWVATSHSLFRVNEELNQFDSLLNLPKADLIGIKFITPNRVYVADKASNQVDRITLTNNKLSATSPLLKTSTDMSFLRDFGVDADIYLLFPSEVKKFVAGKAQAFNLAKPTIAMTDATRIFVGSNLYILEPGKRRLLIYAKNGNLLNQIVLSNSADLKDFYVNETERRINLIDGNSLLEITL